MLSAHIRNKRRLEVANLGHLDIFQVTFIGGVEHQAHFGDRLRGILLLLHELSNSLTVV